MVNYWLVNLKAGLSSNVVCPPPNVLRTKSINHF